MYIGFSKKLKALGGLRIGFGKRFSGAGGWILLFCCAVLNLFWYMILGCLWLMYGTYYVLFYLPIKAVVSIIKKKQIAKKNSEKNNG